MRHQVTQRLRVTFGIHGPLIYLSVLDLGRLWIRLLRRARVPVAYTQGFSPHPRLQFAAALPVGYSSECELVDIFLAQELTPAEFLQMTKPQAPLGLTIQHVENVPLKAKSPQANMQKAHYRVLLQSPLSPKEIEAKVQALLSRQSIIRQRRKKGRKVDYDLRPLIYEIRYVKYQGNLHQLHMVLRCGPKGSGRPEEILSALEIPVDYYTICRTRLIWDLEENAQ